MPLRESEAHGRRRIHVGQNASIRLRRLCGGVRAGQWPVICHFCLSQSSHNFNSSIFFWVRKRIGDRAIYAWTSSMLVSSPLPPQVDPNRGACLDNETGLLVNHAYGLVDMKVGCAVVFLNCARDFRFSISDPFIQFFSAVLVLGALVMLGTHYNVDFQIQPPSWHAYRHVWHFEL